MKNQSQNIYFKNTHPPPPPLEIEWYPPVGLIWIDYQ